MNDTEFQFSTYQVPVNGKVIGTPVITRHMASDGVLSACGDTREDAERMLLIVRRRTYYRSLGKGMYILKDEHK